MANETALVIIDMQHDFISLESPLCMREVSKIIPGIKALIAEARKKGWPVIYVIREHDPSGADIEKFRLKYFEKYPFCITGEKGAEVAEDIRPEKGRYCYRQDALFGLFRHQAGPCPAPPWYQAPTALRGAISQLHSRHCGGRHRALIMTWRFARMQPGAQARK